MLLWLPKELSQRHINDILVFHCLFLFFLVPYSRPSIPQNNKCGYYYYIEGSKMFHPPREMESPLGYGNNGPGFALCLRAALR